MKSLKNLTALVLAVILMLCFAGCSEKQEVTIKENGKSTIVQTVTISETEFTKADEFLKTNLYDGSLDELFGAGEYGEVTKEEYDELYKEITDVFDEFKTQSDLKGWTKTEGDEKYYSNIETESFSSLKELNSSMGTYSSFSSKSFWLYKGEEEVADIEDISLEEALKIIEESGFECEVVMSVTMPYEIEKTNGVLSNENKTVSFDVLDNSSVYYGVCKGSAAAWAKEADINKAILNQVKKQNTPGVPTYVRIGQYSASSNKVRWLMSNACNETEYQVYRKVNSGKWSLLATVNPLSDTSYDDEYYFHYIDKNVKSGNKYYYAVRSVLKGSGFTTYSKFSKVTSVYFVDLKTKPVARVAAGKKVVKVNIANKTKGTTGYEIQYSADKSMKKAKLIKSKNLPKVINTKYSKAYYFRVRKYVKSSVGTAYSAWSNVVQAKTK